MDQLHNDSSEYSNGFSDELMATQSLPKLDLKINIYCSHTACILRRKSLVSIYVFS